MRKILMELMEQSDAGTGIALGRLFPINALTLKVKRSKDRLTLTTLRLMDFALGLCPLPAALHIGLVAKVRVIDKQDR